MSYGHARSLYIGALVCHILGFFFFLPHLISVSLSLDMVRRKYLVVRKTPIIIFSIIELITWVMVPAVGWYFQIETYCYSGYYSYYYNDCFLVVNYTGWIAIVVWFVACLAFGIPRTIMTSQIDGVAPNGVVAPKPVVPVAFAGVAVQGSNYVAQQQPVVYAAPPTFIPAQVPVSAAPAYQPPVAAAPPMRRLPSLETLASELNMPTLLQATKVPGMTSERLFSTPFNVLSDEIKISAEEYLRLKEYKKRLDSA